MDKIEYAIYFATKAHEGQKKKSEDVAVIIHPFSVGMILKNFGCDDDVVIAGILHDTVEDTEVTYEKIEKEFGAYVSKLVKEASEDDKTLSWEDRKRHTIEFSKTISYEAKLIVAADKVNNLSWVLKDYFYIGDDVWKHTKSGKIKQKWYFENLLKALRENACNNKLFDRYEELNNNIFK